MGYGKVLALKWKIAAWQKRSWYAKAGLRLSFWGETFMGVIGGLLIKRPLFFDNYASGTIYREFRTAEDLRHTVQQLERIMSLDKLFERQGTELHHDHTDPPLTYQNLLLGMWAAHCRGLSGTTPAAASIPLKQFKMFFTGLWDDQDPPAIRTDVKTSFAEWVAATSGLALEEISLQYSAIFIDLFREIEEAYARVAVDDLDPRYIHLFRVEI